MIDAQSEVSNVTLSSVQDTILSNATPVLDKVVTIGYGTASRVNFTGAVSVAEGNTLIHSPAINFSQTLVGVVPGLFTINVNGEPGNDEAELRIHGASTFINTQPLVVVDGIPHRNLDRLNSADIESISILKDASAAIYGMQAANGVILVTTKRGKAGKPTVQININGGIQQPTVIPEMANAATYATMLNEIAYYANPVGGLNQIYSPLDIQAYSDGSDPWGHPNTDWFGVVIKPWSLQHNEHVSISGGGERMRYLLALSNKFQDGAYYNSATFYKQQDFRSNMDWQITDNISLFLDISGRQENRNFSSVSTEKNFRMLIRGKPNMPAFWPNGDPGPDLDYGHNPAVTTTDAAGYDKNRYFDLQTNLRLIADIPWIKGLTVKGNISLDVRKGSRELYEIPWYLYTWDGVTVDENGVPVTVRVQRGLDTIQFSESAFDAQVMTYNAFASYQHNQGDHVLNLMVGIENQTTTLENQYFIGGDFAQIARRGYFGRFNYSYEQKYILDAVIRFDGSNMFAGKYGFFPGISMGWRIAEESFWKDNISLFNDFMLRTSWGRTGNDKISSEPANYGWNLYTLEFFNEALSNPDLSWEVSNQLNVGFNATLLNSHVMLEADYFHNLRTGIPMYRNASVPSSAGLSLPLENIGEVSHQGFELVLGYSGTAGSVHYEIALNGTFAQNQVLFMDEMPGLPEYQKATGNPINSGLYYEAIGVFKDQAAIDAYPHWINARPGDIIFRDFNEDGVINGLDRVRNNKNGLPCLTGGFTGSLSFRSFDLTVLVQGSSGAVVYIDPESGFVGNYYEKYASQRWTEENPVSEYPRAWDHDNEYWRAQNNTFWLRETDYIRLKNLLLGFNLPAPVLNLFKLEGFRIYANGWNLFSISKLKLFDPEIAGGNYYANQRIINLGVTLTF